MSTYMYMLVTASHSRVEATPRCLDTRLHVHRQVHMHLLIPILPLPSESKASRGVEEGRTCTSLEIVKVVPSPHHLLQVLPSQPMHLLRLPLEASQPVCLLTSIPTVGGAFQYQSAGSRGGHS